MGCGAAILAGVRAALATRFQRAAGATELRLYHAGLASAADLAAIRRLSPASG